MSRLVPVLATLLALLAACSGGHQTTRTGAGEPSRREPPSIRVRLGAVPEAGPAVVTLAGPYVVTARDEPDEPLLEARATGRLGLTVDGEGVVVDGTPTGEEHVRIDPRPATLGVGDRTYRGTLLARRADDGTLVVALETDLETYLVGVVAGEMPARFGPAALEAQAIAARTYALERIESRASEAWDVWDDTRSQMFVGLPAAAAAAPFEAAVAATRGVALLWDSRVFPCWYHACCGGHTASGAEVFGFRAIPPLTGVPCGFCESAPRYRWSAELPAAVLARAARVSVVTSVTILSRTPSGRVADIRLEGPEPVTMPASELRSRLAGANLPSSWIDEVRIDGDRFAFRGRGHGHGVGLCQYGAAGRAAAGWSARDIVLDFYPGATVSRLW